MHQSILVQCTVLYSIHQIQLRHKIQVPIHQASSGTCSGRPSARCWGWGRGGGVLGTELFFPPRKIAQVLVMEWICGHFHTNCLWRVTCMQKKNWLWGLVQEVDPSYVIPHPISTSSLSGLHTATSSIFLTLGKQHFTPQVDNISPLRATAFHVLDQQHFTSQISSISHLSSTVFHVSGPHL